MEQKERKRTSISPLGLNLSTPDNVVEDGALEVCHNLRFANGAWRNVQEFEHKDIPESLADKDLLYIHPVQGLYNYISRDEDVVTTTKIDYYGTTAYSLEQQGGGGFNAILNYVLDKPLSSVGAESNGVSLYKSNALHTQYNKVGDVVDYRDGVLTYIPKGLSTEDGYITLYYADVNYRKLAKTYNDRFYFVTTTPSPNTGSNAVFVKRGDNYYYWGVIKKITNSTFTINEVESGEDVTCRVDGVTLEHIYLKRCLRNKFGVVQFYCNAYEEWAIYTRGEYIGYFNDQSSEFGGETIKSINDGSAVVYLYNDADDNEVAFARNSGESEEAYKNRYLADIEESSQIWVMEHSACAHTVYPDTQGGSCITFVSDEMVDSEPLPTLDKCYADESKNIVSKTSYNAIHISAYDYEGRHIYTFPDTTQISSITHFGNMLICRDLDRLTTSYFIYGEGTYKPYGNEGKTSLSFKVTVADSIHSPRMTDVPMFYKASGYSASDGSLDGRLFLGAGEVVMPLNKETPNALDRGANLQLINAENQYFRGEFALFVVARAKDGTEIYRTPPQVFRSETLLGTNANVMIYNAADTPDANDEQYYAEAYDFYPYSYLVWDKKLFDRAMGIDKNNPSYEKWHYWIHRYKRYQKQVKPFLDSVKASDLYTLNIDINAEGNNIHTIAIYSTRLYPLFVFEDGGVKTNPVDILNEPFYEMKTFSDGERSYTITYDDFNNIEAKTDKIYEPTQSGEDSFFSREGMEYNNVYHSYDMYVLKPNIDNNTLVGNKGDNLPSLECMTTSRVYDGSVVYATYPAEELFADGSLIYAPSQSNVIVLPDAIREISFGYKDGNDLVALGKFTPEYSKSLNVSYIDNRVEDVFSSNKLGIMQPNGRWNPNTYGDFVRSMQEKSCTYKKYTSINLCNLDADEDVACVPSYPISVTNRIQASDYGNPLTNPYNRSYRVGSANNKIIAINSAAIEMSDAKFGEFPLYVFTTEGVYALQTGGETLYSNVVPISQHIAINPNTLAVDGAVLFFTDKGLHSLSRRGAQLISAGLHEDDNRIPEWMRTCKMVYMPEYNEVMCVLVSEENVTTGKAYILSLDNMCWSERDIPQGLWMNTEEIMVERTLHDLANEGGAVKKEIVMETRPIKLGANKELKRLETLIVRFEADEDEELEVTIKGSIDGVEYKDLRKVPATTNTDVLIRRTPASVKYLKFVVKSSNLQSSIRLIRFDTEHYLRFVRKMR